MLFQHMVNGDCVPFCIYLERAVAGLSKGMTDSMLSIAVVSSSIDAA
jgi:hypothetical protein